jgi:hypothetical protein
MLSPPRTLAVALLFACALPAGGTNNAILSSSP